MQKFCEMKYTKDREGKNVLLKDGKFQVMMEWEKPYMEACIEALEPWGDVLEIGFGLGFSATHIQKYHPRSHTIIEYHPEVIKQAEKWAKNYPNVVLLHDTWQNALKSLGKFEAIFFDDYPLESEQQMQYLEERSHFSSSLLHEGSQLIQNIHEKIPTLKQTKYASEDLIVFIEQAILQNDQAKDHMAVFFQELLQNGQIDDKQYETCKEALQKKGITLAEISSKSCKKGFSFQKRGDRLFEFLEECLNHHMKIGSRFSCFLSRNCSLFEDKEFFEKIITNPFLDFKETKLKIDVPKSCEYFQGQEVFVITVTKRG